jgi:hypothetical protein
MGGNPYVAVFAIFKDSIMSRSAFIKGTRTDVTTKFGMKVDFWKLLVVSHGAVFWHGQSQ